MEKTNKNFSAVFKSAKAKSLYASLFCVLIGLIIGLIILLIMNPGEAFPEFVQMITGGIGDEGIEGLTSILARGAPLILSGLAVLFAYKTGLFNIGVAGQYVMGSFGALLAVLYFKGNWVLGIFMALLFGAIWGAIPGLLKAFFNVSEVIGGIMLNWIALFLTNYLFQTAFKSCVNIQLGYKTYSVTGSGRLPDLGLGDVLGNDFSIAIFLTIIVVIIIYVLLEKTTLGYQLKASGLNKHATRYAGMNDKRNLILTMTISGALAGLAAAFFYLDGLEQISVQLSNSLPGVPWNGIVVAFLCQLNPIGSIFAGVFVALIAQGSKAMTQTIFPSEIGDLITAIIVYTTGLTSFIKILFDKLLEKRKKKSEEDNSYFEGIEILQNDKRESESLISDDNEKEGK